MAETCGGGRRLGPLRRVAARRGPALREFEEQGGGGDGRARWSDMLSALKIGSMGFGGGSALIPVFEDELVTRRGRLVPATFTKQTIVASITPGALPVKLGAMAGLALSGSWSALGMAVLVSVPGTVLTMAAVAMVGSSGGAVRYVELASVGITVFIIALLAHYVSKLVATSHRPRVAAAVVAGTFLVTGASAAVKLLGALVGGSWQADLPRLGAVQAIGLGLGWVALGAALRRGASSPGAVPVDTSAPTAGRRTSRAAALLVLVGLAAVGVATWVHRPAAQLLGLVALSTITSFGGGEAYVAVADGFFVAGGHVEPDVFYNLLVPVANALPGPILIKLASAVGFASAATSGTATAWLVGSAAGLVAISTGASVALLVLGAYDRVSHSPVVRDLGTVLLPIIGGLLVSTSISMLLAAEDVAERSSVAVPPVPWISLGGIAVVAWLRRRGVHDLVLVLSSGLAALVALAHAA